MDRTKRRGKSLGEFTEAIYRTSMGDRIFYIITTLILSLFMLIVLLPIINIVACSFSGSYAVSSGEVYLWPKKFTLDGYSAVFNYHGIWRAYGMTFLYTIVGTVVNVAVTMLCAYPLAQRDLPFKGVIMGLMTFTMYFGGGLIPTYITIMKLGLLNSFWAMIIPGAMSVYNMILARTFIMGIPSELWEAAEIDGCNEFKYLSRVVMPLSVTLLAVLMLFYGVGHWNSYFDAMIYLNDSKMYPLQLLLREILIVNSMSFDSMTATSYAEMEAREAMAQLMKYALIIVSNVPVLVLYPFLKRFFVKGIMLGSVKG